MHYKDGIIDNKIKFGKNIYTLYSLLYYAIWTYICIQVLKIITINYGDICL